MFGASTYFSLRFAARLSCAVCALFTSSLRGAEPTPEGTNATPRVGGVEQESVKAPSKFFRPYRPGDTYSGSEIFKPTLPAIPSRLPVRPNVTKQDEEILDRQRNWIYLTGEEKKTDAKDEARGLEDFGLEGRKGVVARFLEGRPESRLNFGAKNEENSSLTPRPLIGSVEEVETTNPRNDARGSTSLQPIPLEGNFTGSDAQKAKFADLWREKFGLNQNQAREEKEADSKAFLSLFGPRGGAVSGPASGLATLPGADRFGGKSAASPSGASGANALTSSLDPFREAPRRPLGGSSALTEPAFGSRVFNPTPSPLLKPEPPKPVSQPAVLPFPKRHF